MKPIVNLMDESIKKLKKLKKFNFIIIDDQCPEGHGKMKTTLTGVYWCVLCQKYYE